MNDEIESALTLIEAQGKDTCSKFGAAARMVATELRRLAAPQATVEHMRSIIKDALAEDTSSYPEGHWSQRAAALLATPPAPSGAVSNNTELARLQTAIEHVRQQAGIWKQEVRMQGGIVRRILETLGLPTNDWEAETNVALLTIPPTSKATELPDAEEVTLQHLSIGKASCAPSCKYFGGEGCECALLSTSKADTGEAKQSDARYAQGYSDGWSEALGRAAQVPVAFGVMWNLDGRLLQVYRTEEKAKSNKHKWQWGHNYIQPLYADTPATIKAEPTECPYCTSDNEPTKGNYFGRACDACSARMKSPTGEQL